MLLPRRNRVRDCDAWKAVFDAHRETAHTDAGLMLVSLARGRRPEQRPLPARDREYRSSEGVHRAPKATMSPRSPRSPAAPALCDPPQALSPAVPSAEMIPVGSTYRTAELTAGAPFSSESACRETRWSRFDSETVDPVRSEMPESEVD